MNDQTTIPQSELHLLGLATWQLEPMSAWEYAEVLGVTPSFDDVTWVDGYNSNAMPVPTMQLSKIEYKVGA